MPRGYNYPSLDSHFLTFEAARLREAFGADTRIFEPRGLPLPDDAFFSPNGREIVVTEEDVSAVTVLDPATRRIVYRYGAISAPGYGPNRGNDQDRGIHAG